MKQSVFEYRDYKPYLRDWILTQPARGHGFKSKLADAAGCNTTYVTQVLSGSAHFSLEQGEKIACFVGHARNEVIFFLQLIQLARAGSHSLRQLLGQQVEQAAAAHLNLKNRLEFKKSLSSADQATYYSAWYYSAIHVVLSMNTLQTKEALSRYFGLSLNTVSEVLSFLLSTGLAVEARGRFTVGAVSIHLGSDSPMISKHHTNWRVRAITALENHGTDELHYSSVVTMAKADEPKIRAIFVSAIEEARAVVKKSQEEGAYCYTVDFFCLGK